MTDPTTILPSGPAAASGLLKVQGTSRLAFGATTAALVTLASGGTAIVVARGTSSISSPTSLPAGGLQVDAGSVARAVVVDGAPGMFGRAAVSGTEQALLDALRRRAPAARRTLTAPLVQLGHNGGKVQAIDLPETPSNPPPGVKPPVVFPPVVVPPVVSPPVVSPPVQVPPHVPGPPPPPAVVPPVVVPPVPGSHGDDNEAHEHDGKDKGDKGHKHENSRAKTKTKLGTAAGVRPVVIDLRGGGAKSSVRGKHARSGRHAR